MDARFRALDSQSVALHNESIRCLRFRNQQIIVGKSPQFRQVYVLPSNDFEMSLIVFLPLAKQSIILETMHDNVRNALARLEQEKLYKAGEKNLWLPQFKIGDKKAQD